MLLVNSISIPGKGPRWHMYAQCFHPYKFYLNNWTLTVIISCVTECTASLTLTYSVRIIEPNTNHFKTSPNDPGVWFSSTLGNHCPMSSMPVSSLSYFLSGPLLALRVSVFFLWGLYFRKKLGGKEDVFPITANYIPGKHMQSVSGSSWLSSFSLCNPWGTPVMFFMILLGCDEFFFQRCYWNSY